jgi:hypothetical protein
MNIHIAQVKTLLTPCDTISRLAKIDHTYPLFSIHNKPSVKKRGKATPET